MAGSYRARHAHARHLRPAPRRAHGGRTCCAGPAALERAARAPGGRRPARPARRHARAAPRPRARGARGRRARCSPAIGGALAPGAEVVLVPGNHDHALVAPWLEAAAARRRRRSGSPRRSRRATRRRARAAIGARCWRPRALSVAYPGVWLRDDVYATHGHYLDLHATLPTLRAARRRRSWRGSCARRRRRRPTPDDYERGARADLRLARRRSRARARDGRGARAPAARRQAWRAAAAAAAAGRCAARAARRRVPARRRRHQPRSASAR